MTNSKFVGVGKNEDFFSEKTPPGKKMMKLSPLPFSGENAVLILDQNTFKRLKVKKKQSSIKKFALFLLEFFVRTFFFQAEYNVVFF